MNRSQSTSLTLKFQDTEFDVLDLHGQTWLRGLQIASALGLKNPSSDIRNLYDRNAAEFTSDMTQVIELPTAGGRQSVRVFSLRGAHLLGMLARTTVAAAFRRWVLDVLQGLEVPAEQVRLTMPQRLAYLRERRNLLIELAGARRPGFASELYANLTHVSRLLGMGVQPMQALAPHLGQIPLGGVDGF